MEILQVIILGIVQGISEFLPISSSAHLIIFRDIFGIGSVVGEEIGLAFDIALHLGTLLAIVVYFFNDFWNMFIKGITKGVKDDEGKVLWFIVVATIPAAIFGVLFEDIIEDVLRKQFILIACALAFVGVLIYIVDKKMGQRKDIKKMGFIDAIVIGCSQVFALIPGFSRSGTTITAGRARGINREDAAKFSFYLSAPVVLGAVGKQLLEKETITAISQSPSIFIIGILTSFIIGLLCIAFLLKYLKKHDFKIFMWYRIALAIIVILFTIFK